MTGKQHMTIGTAVAAVSTYAYLGGDLSPRNLTTIVAPVLVGSFVGSYMPDIDSKKSKASQVFNKVVLGLILFLGLAHYVNLPIMEQVMGFAKDTVLGNLALLVFLVNTVLGKLSGHRLYTHRWIGTLVFVGSVYFAFNLPFAVGFALGYVLHLLADRTTAAGKDLKFFKVQLPMTNSRGKFHISY